MEILWPLNDVFRAHLKAFESLPYDPAKEVQADFAIERFALGDGAREWEDLPPEVWRVLYERHKQFLMLASAFKARGEPVICSLPDALPEDARLPALMIFGLYRMQLPFPPGGRSPGPDAGSRGSASGGQP